VVAEPPVGDFTALSAAIEITPAGTQFLVDVEVVIPVESLPGDGNLAVYTAATAAGPWEAVPTTVVDSTLVGTISHLSLFQAGMTVQDACDTLCEVLIPCLQSECGLTAEDLPDAITECPILCAAELPIEELEALLDAADTCTLLLEALAPYNPSLIAECELEVNEQCAESVPFVVDCLEAICAHMVPYHEALVGFYMYQCEPNPEQFGQLQMMGCETIQQMFVNEQSLFWNLCQNGPALDGAECAGVLATFEACPMPPGSKFELMDKGMFELFVCGNTGFGFDPACFLSAGSNCNAFLACLPEDDQ
jgi:hypothetical protein